MSPKLSDTTAPNASEKTEKTLAAKVSTETATPPPRFSIDPESIPAKLRERPQWVCWKYGPRRKDNGKRPKPPYCPTTGVKASSTDPSSWSTFDQAVAAATNGNHYDGIGPMLTPNDPYAAIDLDHCVDPAGVIAPWAEQIIASMQSYTELSPSRTGIHIWVRGKLPPGGRKRGHIEVYDQGRYMTVTGQHLAGTPTTIESREEELKTLHQTVFVNGDDGAAESKTDAEPDDPEGPAPDPDPDPASGPDDDDALIARAIESKNSKGVYTFQILWEGHWRENGYKSQSEADEGLCRHLAFWTGKDAKRIDRIFRRSGLFSDKWEQREDYRERTITKAIKATDEVYTPPSTNDGHGAFSVSDAGVYYIPQADPSKRIWICSRLDILAMARDDSGEEWGRVVSIKDADGVEHKWAMPMRLLADAGIECRRVLLSLGLRIGTTRLVHELLSRYLQDAAPSQRVRSVTKTGWHGNVFVLPDQTIGSPDGAQVLLQSAHDTEHHFATSGTLQQWQWKVAKPCVGNSRLVFGVSCPFGAALLDPMGEEGGGFNFRGPSSLGKTTAQIVSGSVCGGGGRSGFSLSWRTTANALENTALAHNDSLLVLDELGQIDPADAAMAAYTLSNGFGKARMSRDGGEKKPATWRLIYLSSSEVSLADHVMSGGYGKRVRGGHEVRLVDVAADAGKGLGLFENIHGAEDAGTFSRGLVSAAKSYYGVALRRYLELLVADLPAAVAFVRGRRELFLHDYVLPESSPEVKRVAGSFGLIAGAGELATRLGIVPWEEGEATLGALRCFDSWVESRGGLAPTDITNGVKQVRLFLEAHGSGRFEYCSAPTKKTNKEDTDEDTGKKSPPKILNRVGFRDSDRDTGIVIYYVLPESFRAELCKGYDAVAVAQELKKQGYLIATDKGHLTVWRHLPEIGRGRVYAILATLMAGETI